MKGTKFLLVIFLLSMVIIGGCKQKSAKSNAVIKKEAKTNLPNESLGTADMPKIYFEKTEHDFGEITAGEIVTFAFKFSNTGGADLLISNVITSCGCTVSEFPTNPIKPNDGGVIKITFDSRGRTGFQKKTVTIEANTLPNKVFIRIKATIKKS